MQNIISRICGWALGLVNFVLMDHVSTPLFIIKKCSNGEHQPRYVSISSNFNELGSYIAQVVLYS